MNSRALWFSTGVAAQDRLVAAHKARFECIEAAINELGKLRSEYGFTIDSLPLDVNAARMALWKAYYAELNRLPATMPRADQVRA